MLIYGYYITLSIPVVIDKEILRKKDIMYINVVKLGV
jgi:hypothetical protein